MGRKDREPKIPWRPTRRELIVYPLTTILGLIAIRSCHDQFSNFFQSPDAQVPPELQRDMDDLQQVIQEYKKIPQDPQETELWNSTRQQWLDLIDKPYLIPGKISLGVDYLRRSKNKVFRDTAIGMSVQGITNIEYRQYPLNEPLVRRDRIQTPTGVRMGIVISSIKLAADLNPENLLFDLVGEVKVLELLKNSGISNLEIEAQSRAQRNEAYLIHRGLTGLPQSIDLNTQESKMELRELATFIRCKQDRSGECWRNYIKTILTPTPPIPTPRSG